MKDKINRFMLYHKQRSYSRLIAYLTKKLIKIRKTIIYTNTAASSYKNKKYLIGSLLYSYFIKKVKRYEKKYERYTNFRNKINVRLDTIITNKHQAYGVEILNLITKLEQTTDEKKQAKIQRKINYYELELRLINAKMEVVDNINDHLTISHLTMTFGGLKAVNNLSFSVRKGEIFGLIGPNGAGKTTVFNCITQFYRANEGAIFFTDRFGQIQRLRNYRTKDIISLGLSRSFQNVELIWELNVIDNLLVGAHSLLNSGFVDSLLHTPKLRREEKQLRTRALEVLTKVGIAQYQFATPYGLPYGILKKIELARALMTNPTLIILDEPAAGLNDQETSELSDLIKRINREMKVTILLVEHDMNLVMNTCDRVCAISFGQLLATGTPDEIKNNKTVQEAYLGGNENG